MSVIRSISIRVNGLKPISSNEMYYTYASKGRAYRPLTAGYIEYTEAWESIVDELCKDDKFLGTLESVLIKTINNHGKFSVENYYLHNQVWTSSGSLHKLDASNPLKPTEDAVVKAMNKVLPNIPYDDRHHESSTSYKLIGDQIGQMITIDGLDGQFNLLAVVDIEWVDLPLVGKQRKVRQGLSIIRTAVEVVQSI